MNIEKFLDYIGIVPPRTPSERKVLTATLIGTGVILILFGVCAWLTFIQWMAPSDFIECSSFALLYLITSAMMFSASGLVCVIIAAAYMAGQRKT